MIALQSLISLFLLLLLGLLYNRYRVDKLRQELFAVRDELFDRARSGEIAFDSRSYTTARLIINGMIRFAHKISISELLLFRFLMPKGSAEYMQNRVQQLFGVMSAEERALADEYVGRANLLVIRHIGSSPFFLLTVLPPVILVVAAKAGYDVASLLKARFERQLRSLDTAAYNEGRLGGYA